MTWTLTNLLIEIVAGIAGGHVAAVAAKEIRFGALGHTTVGALGGALSGYFLQTIVASVVDSTGDVHQDADQVTQWFIQVMTGLAAGAIANDGGWDGQARHRRTSVAKRLMHDATKQNNRRRHLSQPGMRHVPQHARAHPQCRP